MMANLIKTSATRKGAKASGPLWSRFAAMAVLFAPAVLAQPVQTIPDILPMAHEIYRVSHQDMDWHERSYRIFVATPVSRQDTQAPASVLYMLDGNAQFPQAVNEVYKQWSAYSRTASAQAALPLIVGLGYPEHKAYPLQARERDYTYAAPGEQFAGGGGAADFYDFLQAGVRPYIKRQYTGDGGKQMLAGHSFGGLFALYVLLNHRDAFEQYVIGSPSLWWGNGAIVTNADLSAMQSAHALKEKTGAAAQAQHRGAGRHGKSVTILQGEYEENPQSDPDMTPERLARMQQRRSPVTARELNAELRQHGMDSRFILVEKSGHGGVIPAVIQTAVQAALQKSDKE